MSATVRQLAEWVQGQVSGDPEAVVRHARPFTEAGAGDVTFAESDKHLAHLGDCTATAVVVPTTAPPTTVTLIRVTDPLAAFITIVQKLHPKMPEPPPGIHPQAFVDPTATVGANARIAAFASVGANTVVGANCRLATGAVVGANCRLGDDVTLHANAVLYDDTILGHRVIVHANAVVGADGYGYRFANGQHVKVPQLGSVEIGDDVEIGACSTIDRGTFGPTRIGAGTKLDNLVHVAHNCRIGRHNLFCAQVGIAGSSSTGDYVIVAGQVGITDHVHIGDRVIVGAKAGVTKDIPVGQRVLGAPATPERDQKRILMSLEKLPDLRKDVRRIKKQLGISDDEG